MPIHPIAALALVAACASALLAAGCSSAQGGAGEAYTGVLRGGVMAVGGETTGWALERDGHPAVQGVVAPIDLDPAAVDLDALARLDGRRVRVVGRVERRDFVERGPTPVLVAESIRAAK